MASRSKRKSNFARRLVSAGFHDPADPLINVLLHIHEGLGVLQVPAVGVLGDVGHVRHLLQLRGVHGLDGFAEHLNVLAVLVELLDELQDCPAGVVELDLRML